MALTSSYKRAGWSALLLLLAIVALVAATGVWLVGPPNWRGSVMEIAWIVVLMAFGPALGRWASTSVRRTFLVSLAVFVATFCVEAVLSGLPVWGWRGFAGLVAVSFVQTFGLLVMLAIMSLLRPPAHGGLAMADGNGDDSGQEAEKSR